MPEFTFTDAFYNMILAGELDIISGSDNNHYIKDLHFAIDNKKSFYDVNVFQGNKIIATMTVKNSEYSTLHLSGIALGLSINYEFKSKLDKTIETKKNWFSKLLEIIRKEE